MSIKVNLALEVIRLTSELTRLNGLVLELRRKLSSSNRLYPADKRAIEYLLHRSARITRRLERLDGQTPPTPSPHNHPPPL